MNPAANRLYVAAGSDIKVVDTASLAVIAAIPVEGYATAVALNPSTNRLYVRTQTEGVVVIDTLTNSVVRTFVVSDMNATAADIGVNAATNAVYVPMAGHELVWVTQDPAPFGGRDFGITVVPGGVRLTWTPGTEEASYSIVRWAADSDTVETLEGLPQGTTSFVDQEPLTESAYHYALLPLDAGGVPLWVSDVLVCSRIPSRHSTRPRTSRCATPRTLTTQDKSVSASRCRGKRPATRQATSWQRCSPTAIKKFHSGRKSRAR